METAPASPEPKQLPSDEELAAMLSRASGDKPGKKPRRDPLAPSPRLPEAAYYYLFILVEAAILIGVWGFMRLGIEAALEGPSFESPIMEQIKFHVSSIGAGIASVCTGQPWIPAGVAVIALPVFMPVTPRSRKRMATIISTVLVAVFLLLIALQFNEDIANASAMNQF